MGRWRPLPPKSSPYITAEGYRQLEAELRSIWQRRRDVTQALAAAAAEGDRSENAEYIYRKKELREIDRRIRYLQKRLPELKIVDAVGDTGRIYFGAWVRLETPDGLQFDYRIVGPDEIDQHKDYISIDSILARALLGKTCDDEIAANSAGGQTIYLVMDISYHPD
jgi:transcription elongation factor GreB